MGKRNQKDARSINIRDLENQEVFIDLDEMSLALSGDKDAALRFLGRNSTCQSSLVEAILDGCLNAKPKRGRQRSAKAIRQYWLVRTLVLTGHKLSSSTEAVASHFGQEVETVKKSYERELARIGGTKNA